MLGYNRKLLLILTSAKIDFEKRDTHDTMLLFRIQIWYASYSKYCRQHKLVAYPEKKIINALKETSILNVRSESGSLPENTEHIKKGNVDITLFSIYYSRLFQKMPPIKFFCSLYFFARILRQFVLHSRLVEQYLVFANGFFHLYKHLPDSQQNSMHLVFAIFM